MIDSLCKDIVKRFKINRIVETGTDKGETIAEASRWFSQIDPDFGTVVDTFVTEARSYHLGSEAIAYPVFSNVKPSRYEIHSVDLDLYSYEAARKHFSSNSNIHLHHSSSEKLLDVILAPELGKQDLKNNYLFFLDAHWGEYWPLRDELKIILKLTKYAIVIDDFMVPGKSNVSFPHGAFGFDIYKGRVLNWAYICDLFADIKVKVFYPERANRDGRGWVLITHGYADSELEFLGPLGLFEKGQFDQEHTAVVKVTWLAYCDTRNVLKKMIPVSLLRVMFRWYEKISYQCSSFLCFKQGKD